VNESVGARGSVLGCECSGSMVSRAISWGRLFLGLFLALGSVEKAHCRPSIAGQIFSPRLPCQRRRLAVKQERKERESLLYVLMSPRALALFFFFSSSFNCLSQNGTRRLWKGAGTRASFIHKLMAFAVEQQGRRAQMASRGLGEEERTMYASRAHWRATGEKFET